MNGPRVTNNMIEVRGGGEEESFSKLRENHELDAASTYAKFKPSSMDASDMSTLSASSGITAYTAQNSFQPNSQGSQNNTSTATASAEPTLISRRGCMTVRTQEESLNPTECEIARKLRKTYLSRNRDRTASPSVGFDVMTVNWHPMIMGDNPSGTKGPPLTIDWDPVDTSVCLVDDFERERRARTSGEMKMPSDYRFEYLVEQGVKKKDIIQNQRMVRKSKIQRAETRRTFYMFHSDERKENMVRRMKNMIQMGKKKKERQFLAMSKEMHDLQKFEADEAAMEMRNLLITGAAQEEPYDRDADMDMDMDDSLQSNT